MVYQYDQALQLPTVDLYDTQMMAMALQAAKDMYDRGEQQIKDFQKNFGDFLTPITADQNWWNQNVTGRVRDAINQMYARGGDPLRNAQDRAQISMLINNMPYGDMAFKRQRAENAKEYYKNLATLRMNDKYSEDFSKFLGEDPSQWAENYTGVTSPTVFSDLNAKTSHWFDGVNKKGYLYTKDGYDYFGVDPNELKKVLNSQIPDFINTPYGKYQLELARKQVGPNASDSEAIERLKNNIIDYNRELTISPTRQLNPVAELELKDKYDARKQEREFKYAVALQNLKNAGNPGSRSTNGNGVSDNDELVTPLNVQIKDSVNQKVLEAMGIRGDGNARTKAGNINAIIDYYQNKIDQIEKTRGKKVQDGYETITEFASGGGISPTLGVSVPSRNITKKIPKYKYEYDGSKDREYQTYKTKIAQYKAIAENGSPLTGQEQRMLSFVLQKNAEGKQLNNAEKNIYKSLTRKMEFFARDYRDDFYRMRSNESNLKGGDKFAAANDEFYGMFTFSPQDKASKQVALGMFTGYADKGKYKSLPGEYYIVNFNDAGIEYAPIRKANVSGPRGYKYNSIQNKFSEWLKTGQVQGVLIDQSAQFADIPKEFSNLGDSQLDVVANPAIDAESFLQFFNTLPNKYTKSDLADVARNLGLIPISAEGTILNQDKDGYNKASYYKVPTIRTMDNRGGYQYAQMNNQYNIYQWGQSTAYKNAINSEAASLTTR